MSPSPTVSPAAQRSPAQTLVGHLKSGKKTLALAESCTCGMAAALIGGVPGASTVFCGSVVTYRPSAKGQWLGVSEDVITRCTAESPETTQAMASGLLATTTEADFAAAITGHLGPDAPPDKDGIVYVALFSRTATQNAQIGSESFRLRRASRVDRQIEAAERWLAWISKMIGGSA